MIDRRLSPPTTLEATGGGQGACDAGGSNGITAASSSVDEFQSLDSGRFARDKPCSWVGIRCEAPPGVSISSASSNG